MGVFNPEDFIKEFNPGDNPFEVSIIKLIDPRTVDILAMDKPLLVKMLSKIKMRAFSDEHRLAFENLIRAIEIREMFCGIFTPNVSEVYYDKDVMIVDLTSYIKPGMEMKIARLYNIASESPIVHEEKISKRDMSDRAITNLFIRNIIHGNSIGDSLKDALQPEAISEEQSRMLPTVHETETEMSSPAEPEPVDDFVHSVLDDKISRMEKAAKDKKSKKKKKKKKKKKAKPTPTEEPAPEPEPVPEPGPPQPEVGPEPVPEPEPMQPEVGPEPAPDPEPPQPGVEPEPGPATEEPEVVSTETRPTSGLGDLMSRLRSIDMAPPTTSPEPQEEEHVHEEVAVVEPDAPPEELAPEPETQPDPPVEEPYSPEEDVPPQEEAMPEEDTHGGETAEAEAGASSLELIMKRLRNKTTIEDDGAKVDVPPSEPEAQPRKEALHDAVADGTISNGDTEVEVPLQEDDKGKKKKRRRSKKKK